MDGSPDSAFRANIDMSYLGALGLAERLPDWRQLLHETGRH